MPASSYIISLRVTAPNGRQHEDVITADLDLTTTGPASHDQIRSWAISQLAERTGRPADALEVDHFTYTTLPTA
ncbi:hypothetical protein [Streptomyces cinereoruber]|uniref:hypothetical protein n=1 Tax=Streptomyces cinereoruber TaxID=67260 RepID=UPI003C2F4550